MVEIIKTNDGLEWVLKSDYDKLAGECIQMKSIINYITTPSSEPEYHEQGMGCGLEDRGIHDRYDAMHYGWHEAMERVYSEVISRAEELNFESTNAAIAEIKAQGVDELAMHMEFNGYSNEASGARAYAANLRAEEN